jgi:transglutaminase-like putative cysteine protease
MASARHGEALKLELGCRFDHVAEVAVPAVAIVEPHSSMLDAIVAESWEGESVERYEDVDGNRCRRLILPAGASSFAYTATIRVSPEPDEVPGPSDAQHLIEDLPSALLHWLLPSRFCESDRLGDTAWELFGGAPSGAGCVQAVCDWIHEHIAYGVPTVPTTTASEVLTERGGMCRDFAHLGITFCRALGIPARYVSGYLPVIGDAAQPDEEEDFHAWFEVWLGTRWWTFDARFNVPRIGRVPIGRGRDAGDVAMVTTYGPATLARMSVWAEARDEQQQA